jgi:hypothetical protein
MTGNTPVEDSSFYRDPKGRARWRLIRHRMRVEAQGRAQNLDGSRGTKGSRELYSKGEVRDNEA